MAREAAHPGGAGFLDIALDQGARIDEVGPVCRRHRQRRSRMMVSDSGSPSMAIGWSSGSSSSMSRAGSGRRVMRPAAIRRRLNSSRVSGFFFAAAAFGGLAFLADGGASGLLRLGELAGRAAGGAGATARRQALDAAQEVVEVGLRHRYIRVIIDYPSLTRLPRLGAFAKFYGLGGMSTVSRSARLSDVCPERNSRAESASISSLVTP